MSSSCWPKGSDVPKPKEVVTLLCPIVRRTEEPCTKDPKRFNKYIYFKCPMGNLCKFRHKGSEFRCPQGYGYQNGINHLLSCIGKGSHLPVIKLYEEERAHKKRQSEMGEHFVTNVMPVSPKEEDLLSWIDMIIMKNLPLNIVEDGMFRKFAVSTNIFSIKTVRAVILAMVPLVEKMIIKEMKAAGYGALMHDGWTKFSTHYFGLFATYNIKVKQKLAGELCETTMPKQVLLAVSPLTTLVSEKKDSNKTTESTNFKAEVMAQFIEKTLEEYYDTDLKWVKCETSDNAGVNTRAAKLMGIPHIPCKNHLLSSEVENMVSCSREEARILGVADIIDKVHQTMSKAKGSIKNAAVLRGLTHLRPSPLNGVKWSTKATMLNKFDRIRDQLIEANEDDDCEITIDDSNQFKVAAKKLSAMFHEINAVTLALQTRLYPLKECREDLDSLIEAAIYGHDIRNSPWYKNTLGDRYIGPQSEKLSDPAFESGVVKIQRGEEVSMTLAEKVACRSLEVGDDEIGEEVEAAEEEVQTLMKKLKEKKRKRKAGEFSSKKSEYLNVDFISGSAAEVERLWSICKYILTVNRSGLSPILLEAILFLRINRSFWDIKLVQEAYTNTKEKQRTSRLEREMAEDIGYWDDEMEGIELED